MAVVGKEQSCSENPSIAGLKRGPFSTGRRELHMTDLPYDRFAFLAPLRSSLVPLGSSAECLHLLSYVATSIPAPGVKKTNVTLGKPRFPRESGHTKCLRAHVTWHVVSRGLQIGQISVVITYPVLDPNGRGL